eukprot:SAG31_NODE_2217_length_6168_cov_10.730598_6_plen_85_part_00
MAGCPGGARGASARTKARLSSRLDGGRHAAPERLPQLQSPAPSSFSGRRRLRHLERGRQQAKPNRAYQLRPRPPTGWSEVLGLS